MQELESEMNGVLAQSSQSGIGTSRTGSGAWGVGSSWVGEGVRGGSGAGVATMG